MTEIWKYIPNTNNHYQISSLGRVRIVEHDSILKNGKKRHYKTKILTPVHRGAGYCYVTLYRKNYAVHRLVLETFIGKVDGCEPNHKDENKDNNSLENLEWITHRQNCLYGTRNKRAVEHRDQSGENNGMFGRFGYTKRSIPVKQFTLSGEFIADYRSLGDAEKVTGVTCSHISRALRKCNGIMKNFGFKWEAIPKQ